MRILIQSRVSKLFLGEDGWTSSQDGARDFHNSALAVQYCLKERMMDVRILLAFNSPELNVYLEPFVAYE